MSDQSSPAGEDAAPALGTIAYQTAFPNAECKLFNAAIHLDRFAFVAQRHLARLRPKLSVVHEVDGTAWIDIGFVDEPVLPVDVALALGDAIHNTRGALDFAISDICYAVNPTKPRSHRVSFPFEGSEDRLRKKLASLVKEEGLPLEIAKLIETDFKPWGSMTDRSGNYPLWSLSKLDNDDKHKLLTPAIHVTTLSGVNCRAFYENGGLMCFSNTTLVLRNDKGFALAGLGSAKLARLEVDDIQQVDGEARFQGDYFKGEPVIPVLNNLRMVVGNILGSLTPHMDKVKFDAK